MPVTAANGIQHGFEWSRTEPNMSSWSTYLNARILNWCHSEMKKKYVPHDTSDTKFVFASGFAFVCFVYSVSFSLTLSLFSLLLISPVCIARAQMEMSFDVENVHQISYAKGNLFEIALAADKWNLFAGLWTFEWNTNDYWINRKIGVTQSRNHCETPSDQDQFSNRPIIRGYITEYFV